MGKNANEDMIHMLSVEHQVTSAYPPTFLWCGDADQTVNPFNSHMMEATLKKMNVPCQFVEYPAVDHGVGLGEGLACEDWIEKTVAFWEAYRKK